MSSSPATILSSDCSVFSLDENVQAALHAAALQAKERRHHFIGAEHLLAALLQRENGDGAAHAFLRSLHVETALLRDTLSGQAGKAPAHSVPARVALRSDSRAILMLANDLRQQRGEPLTHAGHVTEALLCHGNSDAARAVGYYLNLEPAPSRNSPRHCAAACTSPGSFWASHGSSQRLRNITSDASSSWENGMPGAARSHAANLDYGIRWSATFTAVEKNCASCWLRQP